MSWSDDELDRLDAHDKLDDLRDVGYSDAEAWDELDDDERAALGGVRDPGTPAWWADEQGPDDGSF